MNPDQRKKIPFLFIIFGLPCVMLVFSLYLNINRTHKSQIDRLSSQMKLDQAEIAHLKGVIGMDKKNALNQLHQFEQKQKTVPRIFAEISQALPNQIELLGLSYDGDIIQLEIGSTREEIIHPFREQLARSPCFQNIQISENKASTRLKAQMGPSC
jgi:Tfp pilus assembly protein PilN